MFPSDEELISAYLDDELSAEERLRAEQLLAERADLRRLLEELRGVREGLQSLPAYALGDDFSSLVLKRAEREVLKDDAASRSSATAARANVDEPVTPADSAAGDARSAHGSNGDYRHSWRPLGWAIAALAAAVVLTVVQRGWIADRRQEVAMNQRVAEDAGADRTGAAKGDAVATTAAPAAPPTAAMRKEAGTGAPPANVDVAKKAEDLAGTDRRAGAFGGDAMRGLNLPATTAPVAGPAEAEGLVRRTAPMMTKAGVAPGAADGDLEANALPGNAGRNNMATNVPQPVVEIAQADFNRAATIVSQLRSLKKESQIAHVPAAQLQQRLAVVEETRLQERSNVAGDLAQQSQYGSQSQTAPQSQAVQTPRPAAIAAVGERAKLNDDKSDGAAVAGQPAVDERRDQTEKRTFAEQQLIPSQLGGNVIVVYVDGTREALDKVLVPTLQTQQIADLNNSWQPQALALAATNTYTGVLDSIAPQLAASNASPSSLGEPTSRPPVSRQRGDLAKSDAGGGSPSGSVGEKKQAEKARDGQQAYSDESSTGGEEEFFYVVCPTDKLEATLSTLKSQPQYVLNLRCEPGPTTPQEEQRWLAYNRGGAYGSGGVATSSAVAKSSSGTLSVSGAAGGNGIGLPSQAINNFAVDNKLPTVGLSLQTQAVQPSRAQRLTSRQVVELESIAESQLSADKVAIKSNADADSYKSKSMSEATPPKADDAPAAAPAPAAAVPATAAATSQAATVQTAQTEATQAFQQDATANRTQQQAAAPAGGGFNLSLSQTSPTLPPDYREAIFVFRVVAAPATEVAAPADAKPAAVTPVPANSSPVPTKPAEPTPPIKKAG